MIYSLFSTLTLLYMTDWTDLTPNSLSPLCFSLSPSFFLCIFVCVCSKDLAGALDAALECQKLYNQLPRIHDIIVGLVEKGDTELLQKGFTFIHSALTLLLIHLC